MWHRLKRKRTVLPLPRVITWFCVVNLSKRRTRTMTACALLRTKSFHHPYADAKRPVSLPWVPRLKPFRHHHSPEPCRRLLSMRFRRQRHPKTAAVVSKRKLCPNSRTRTLPLCHCPDRRRITKSCRHRHLLPKRQSANPSAKSRPFLPKIRPRRVAWENWKAFTKRLPPHRLLPWPRRRRPTAKRRS